MKKKEKNRNWKSKSISKPSTNLKGNITAFVQIEEANRKRNPHTLKKYKKNHNSFVLYRQQSLELEIYCKNNNNKKKNTTFPKFVHVCRMHCCMTFSYIQVYKFRLFSFHLHFQFFLPLSFSLSLSLSRFFAPLLCLLMVQSNKYIYFGQRITLEVNK